MKKNESKLTIKELAILGVMTTLLIVSVHALAPLPNVEPVTVLVILFTLSRGRKVGYILAAYLLLEGCWYGFGLWWIMYAYIWPFLALLTWLLRRQRSVWFWSLVAGAFGLFFGAMCSIPYLFIGGPSMAFTWWVAGIPYDLIHCLSNAILCMVLFHPLSRVLERV